MNDAAVAIEADHEATYQIDFVLENGVRLRQRMFSHSEHAWFYFYQYLKKENHELVGTAGFFFHVLSPFPFFNCKDLFLFYLRNYHI